MAERLTKTELIDELTRRIEWFKKAYGFKESANSISDMADNPDMLIKYGRFLAAYEARDQIKKRLFLGGYTC